MKTRCLLLIIAMSILALVVTACSKTSLASASTSSGLSAATRLALGTLKLENTSNEVSASQASQLLTLWEGYLSLSKSDTSSEVELEALLKQIEATMTPAQIKAIEAMELSEQTAGGVLQSSNPSTTVSSASVTPSISTYTNSQAGPGGAPAGVPVDGGMPLGDITSAVTTQSTQEATISQSYTQANQIDVQIISALIQMLETRSQTTG
jgi:hypothetical protein